MLSCVRIDFDVSLLFGLTCYQNMLSYINMSSTHRKTMEFIFGKPVPASLKWQRIEALLLALGAQAVEGENHEDHEDHEDHEA